MLCTGRRSISARVITLTDAGALRASTPDPEAVTTTADMACAVSRAVVVPCATTRPAVAARRATTREAAPGTERARGAIYLEAKDDMGWSCGRRVPARPRPGT